MKILKAARVPLVTLVLLATLLVTSSAFAAAPMVPKATPKVFSYMDSGGGGCLYDHMSSFSADDD